MYLLICYLPSAVQHSNNTNTHQTIHVSTDSSDIQRKRLFLDAKNKDGLTCLDIASRQVEESELDLTRKYVAYR